MGTTQIIHGDCIEELKKIPDNSVDVIITDPPYNISKLNDNRDRSKMNAPIHRRTSPITMDFGEWDNMERKEFLEFTKEWLKECCRILKEDGSFISFFNKEDISYLGWIAKDFGVRTRVIFSWHKTNPVPSFRKVNYLSACEFIWIGSKGKYKTFNFKQQKEMHNFFETPNKSSYGKTKHPTEKPVSLIKHFLEIHSNEGDTILDPFGGSGTTAVACKQLGRNCIIIEKEKQWIGSIKQRLEQNSL